MTTIVSKSILVSALLSVVACGGTPANSASAGTRETTLPGTPLSPEASVPSTVSISGFVHGADAAPLAGVDVCLQSGPEVALPVGTCATSGTDGAWTLSGVPSTTQITVAFEKDGYAATLRAIETDTTDIVLPSDENVLAPVSSPSVGAATGSIQFFANVSGGVKPSDLTVTATNLEGTAVDSNPVVGATGVFQDVQTGYYVLTFHSSSATCAATSGLYGFPMTVYQDVGSTRILVPVIDGYVTAPVGVECAPL